LVLLWRLTQLFLFGPLETLISPVPLRARVAFLSTRAYAHRGLHGAGRVENSRAAFRAAIDAGFGIELDVQMSHDGEAFVFHDAVLDRLTHDTGPVSERRAAELSEIKLRGTDETIPKIAEVLSLIDGKVPLLIEVKAEHGPVGGLCLAVRRALEGYRGQVAIMSFNPQVGRWFRDHAPRLVRGLVVTENRARKLPDRVRGALARGVSLWRAKPEFLAYDIRDLPSRFAARQRRRGLPILTWTVREADQERTAAAHADEIIFEQAGGKHP
jgi:glycerophosphoryl diester phosphodiesterase